MRDLIEKKLKSAKICRVLMILFAVLFFVGIAFTSVFLSDLGPEVCVPVLMIACWSFFICLIVYFTKFFAFTRSVRRLSALGWEHIGDDINLERPTLPRSKIYCGQNAFYSKKSGVILPYQEVAWVYLHEQRTYGITVARSVILHTRDGKKYQLEANADEFKWILEHYIMPKSPQLIIGYGGLQAQQYKQLQKQQKEEK